MPSKAYEIAVGRSSLCQQAWNGVLCQQDDNSDPLRLACSLPLPKTSGSIDLISRCMQRTPATTSLTIAVPDLNIVNFLSNPPAQSVDDQQLLRLSSAVQRFRGKLEVKKAADYGRLRLSPGEAPARARLLAVEESALFFYPSPHPQSQDAWEVRFLNKRDSKHAVSTYERFLDWGEHEILRYIELAVKLGDVERLQPERLAMEDPGMFWQICFRFRETFPLLRAKAGQKGWAERMEEGLTAASKCGKAADSLPSFGRKMEQAVLGREEERRELATRGAAYGMLRTVEKAGKEVQLGVEVDEDLQSEPFGSFVSEVEQRQNHPEEKLRQDLERLQLAVGVRVELQRLVKAPQYNGVRGTVKGVDVGGQRLEVELEGGQMLRVRPENARREGGDRGTDTDASLQGACRVCAGCKRTEEAPGVYKACSRCRSVYYCGAACQAKDWKEGDHKKVCGKGAEALQQAGVVRYVVLPSNKDAYPYVQTAQGSSFAEQMRHIGMEVLACTNPDDMWSRRLERGESSELIGVLLFFNQRVTADASARGNARASGLTVPPGTMLQLDGRGDLSAVCGDAVLLRMACEEVSRGQYTEVSPQRLADLDLETYQRSLGIFSMVQIPTVGVLTSFFGKTAEGEAAAEEMGRMLAGRASGLPRQEDLMRNIEARAADKTAAANRKKSKKKR